MGYNVEKRLGVWNARSPISRACKCLLVMSFEKLLTELYICQFGLSVLGMRDRSTNTLQYAWVEYKFVSKIGELWRYVCSHDLEKHK